MRTSKPTVPVHWDPIPTMNRFSVFRESEGDEEYLEPNDSKMRNQFPLMLELIGVLGDRTNEKALVESNSSGFVWKPVTRKVHSRANNNVAPFCVSVKTLVYSSDF